MVLRPSQSMSPQARSPTCRPPIRHVALIGQGRNRLPSVPASPSPQRQPPWRRYVQGGESRSKSPRDMPHRVPTASRTPVPLQSEPLIGVADQQFDCGSSLRSTSVRPIRPDHCPTPGAITGARHQARGWSPNRTARLPPMSSASGHRSTGRRSPTATSRQS